LPEVAFFIEQCFRDGRTLISRSEIQDRLVHSPVVDAALKVFDEQPQIADYYAAWKEFTNLLLEDRILDRTRKNKLNKVRTTYIDISESNSEHKDLANYHLLRGLFELYADPNQDILMNYDIEKVMGDLIGPSFETRPGKAASLAQIRFHWPYYRSGLIKPIQYDSHSPQRALRPCLTRQIEFFTNRFNRSFSNVGAERNRGTGTAKPSSLQDLATVVHQTKRFGPFANLGVGRRR